MKGNRKLLDKGGVYKITVKGIGNAFYETRDIWEQVSNHKSMLDTGKHYNSKLQELYKLRPFSYNIIARSNDPLLRSILWNSQCITWPANLNDYGPHTIYIHKDHMPDQKYWKQEIYLERIPKTRLMIVREKKHGKELGFEMAMDTVRSGAYIVDSFGNLLPTHAPRYTTYRGAL